MKYTYDYPRPAVTTDCIIVRKGETFELLLIERKYEPFKGKWALPGGFVEIDEDLEAGALRELEEETGLAGIALRQFKTYGSPGRDPRGRTISVVFYGFLENTQKEAVAGDDATETRWFSLDKLPPLAFDHAVIMADFSGFIGNLKA